MAGTLGPLPVAAHVILAGKGLPQPGIHQSLDAVQMLDAVPDLQGLAFFTLGEGIVSAGDLPAVLLQIVVDIPGFALGQVHIYAAEGIHDRRDAMEVDGHVVLDIHFKVVVDGGHGTLGIVVEDIL